MLTELYCCHIVVQLLSFMFKVFLYGFAVYSVHLQMKVKYAKLQIGSCSRSRCSDHKDIFNYSFRSD